MNGSHFLMGSIFMRFVIIHHAAGQAPSGVSGREAARQLIEETLEESVQQESPKKQISLYHLTCTQVLELCPTNVVVRESITQAKTRASAARDDQQAIKLLREGLRAADETLGFKPFIEAPLPEGFPEPTPVGEIMIKHYPKYRLARTQMAGAQTVAFWTLFTHIKKKDIAMTAPVEMTYGVNDEDRLQGQKMAFLYRSTKQGILGNDEKVEVIDVPAMTVLSIGVRGDVTKARLAEAKAHLDAWLKEHANEYQASGPLRVMGYNSPFVAANRRFTEVEIPVRQMQQSPNKE